MSGPGVIISGNTIYPCFKPTRYVDQMRESKRTINSEWSLYVSQLKKASQRWAHDEDIVSWVRRTLCEIGA